MGFPVKLKISGHLVLEDKDFKKTKKFTWLSASEETVRPVKLVEFAHLISKRKVEEEDEIEDIVVKDSRDEKIALAEVRAH